MDKKIQEIIFYVIAAIMVFGGAAYMYGEVTEPPKITR